LVYGDDLLVPAYEGGRPPLDITRVLGLKLVMARVRPYSPIPFLSRWFLPGGSFVDPLRALAKIHTAIPRGLDLPMTAANRAIGYLVTDGDTPLVSSICRYLMRKYQVDNVDYKYGYDHEWDVKVSMGPWVQPPRGEMLPTMAQLLGISVDQLEIIDGLVGAATDDVTFPEKSISNPEYVTPVSVEVLDGNVIFTYDAPQVATTPPTHQPRPASSRPATTSTSSSNHPRGSATHGRRIGSRGRIGHTSSADEVGNDNSRVTGASFRSGLSSHTISSDGASGSGAGQHALGVPPGGGGSHTGDPMSPGGVDPAPNWFPDAVATPVVSPVAP